MPTRLPLVLVLAALLGACSLDSTGPEEIRIEDTRFHPDLQVNLAASTRTPSGLYYRDLRAGTGPVVAVGDLVNVRYAGYFPDGRLFDASRGDDTLDFTVGGSRVIPGLGEGVVGMSVGGQRQIIIPHTLAYGPGGSGIIPPYQTLVFLVEVSSIQRGS